jgi:hypothetical protein
VYWKELLSFKGGNNPAIHIVELGSALVTLADSILSRKLVVI